MSYAVRIPVYEGPFELLLHLILKEEVDIWDVKIAEVIDAFIAEVESLDRVDLDVATEFLLIASTLVELKVRRLLPGSEMTELDEELLRFEERDLLLGRLAGVQDVQGRGPGPRGPAAPRRQGRVPQRRGRGAVPEPGAGPARARHRQGPPRRRAPGAHAAAGAARGGPRPRGADPDQRPRRRRRAARPAARHRTDELPGARRRHRRPHRGDRPVPRRARALQAGHRRRRPGRDLRGPHRAPALRRRVAHRRRVDGGLGRRRRCRPSRPRPTPPRTPSSTRWSWRSTSRERSERAGHDRDQARDRSGAHGRGRADRAAVPRPAHRDAGRRDRSALHRAPRRVRARRARLHAGEDRRRLPLPDRTPTWRPTSSASCSTGSTPACRVRRSRRSRSSPTSSRCHGRSCRRSAA